MEIGEEFSRLVKYTQGKVIYGISVHLGSSERFNTFKVRVCRRRESICTRGGEVRVQGFYFLCMS